MAAIAKQTIGKYSLDSSRKYPQGVEVEDGNFRVTLVSRAPKVVLVIGGYGQSKKVKALKLPALSAVIAIISVARDRSVIVSKAR